MQTNYLSTKSHFRVVFWVMDYTYKDAVWEVVGIENFGLKVAYKKAEPFLVLPFINFR
jgi:hypothetical protein